jgi:hypothetical protein
VVVRRVIAFVVPLVFGGLLGAVVGGIVSGNEGYAIVWALGIPVGIILAVVYGVANSPAAKKKSAQAATPVGINATKPVRLRRGIAIAMVALGAALALIPASTMLGWVASDLVQGRLFDGRDMRTGLHQNDAMVQIAEVVGSPDITQANFYDSYVIVTARTSARSDTADTYMWRNGGAYRDGPAGFQPDLASELFDASAIDFSMIPKLITIAKRDAGMNDAEDYYPSVARETTAEGLGDPVISISLSDEYYDAYYVFSLDGDIVSKSGTAFE